MRAALLVVLVAHAAWAEKNDFRLIQLGNPQPGATGHDPRANANFRSFARQFAAAMTSMNLMPPETLGHAAFSVSIDTAIINFGTGTLPTQQALSTGRPFRDWLALPSVHFRKGLPFSFELGGRFGWVPDSRMGFGTAELKWAINEGFRYFPDIGVRGSITKLINSRDFDITAGGLDVGLGKQFQIGGMVTLTPYAGWNLMFVGASTSTIDFNPSRALAEADGPEQFKDLYLFAPVLAIANTHNRFYGGLRFIGAVVQLVAEVSYSVIGRFRDTKGDNDPANDEDRDVPGVLGINLSLGLDF